MAVQRQRDDSEMISDINVTPFVDVALVLLVIFMVTATYIVAKSIPMDLPEAATGEDVMTTFAIAMTTDGQIFLDGAKVDDGALKQKLRAARAKNKDVRVVIAADRAVSHGSVVHVIDLVRREGVSKFAINIESDAAK